MPARHGSRRARVAGGIAVLCAGLAVLTLFTPDWIETLTGADPDGGNGAAEVVVIVALCLVAVIVGGYSLSVQRRVRSAEDHSDRGA